MKHSETRAIKIAPLERVIAVVPEYCAGPGWANAVVWVYIENHDKTLRTECLQPEEQTPLMHALYTPGAAMHKALIAAVPIKEAKR